MPQFPHSPLAIHQCILRFQLVSKFLKGLCPPLSLRLQCPTPPNPPKTCSPLFPAQTQHQKRMPFQILLEIRILTPKSWLEDTATPFYISNPRTNAKTPPRALTATKVPSCSDKMATMQSILNRKLWILEIWNSCEVGRQRGLYLCSVYRFFKSFAIYCRIMKIPPFNQMSALSEYLRMKRSPLLKCALSAIVDCVVSRKELSTIQVSEAD